MKNEKGEVALGILIIIGLILAGLGVAVYKEELSEPQREGIREQIRIAECVKENPGESLTEEEFKECEEAAKRK